MKAGITGHQDLGSDANARWVSDTLDRIIKKYEISLGYTCLAVGTDQIYASLLKNLNKPYVAVIPCDKYENTFSNSNDLGKYRELLAYADSVHALPFDKPAEVAFFEAGKKIVDLSETLIAVWDGKAAKGLGGTGDVVQYAVTKHKKVIHVNPETHRVGDLVFSGKPSPDHLNNKQTI